MEIKPLASFPARRIVKPDPPLMYCAQTLHPISFAALIVCPSDLLESTLGLLPWMLGHVHETLGVISSWVVYLAVVYAVGKKAFREQTSPLFAFLFFILIAWVFLIWLKILPFAFL